MENLTISESEVYNDHYDLDKLLQSTDKFEDQIPVPDIFKDEQENLTP